MTQKPFPVHSPRRQRGVVLPITAIAMVALLAAVALALDVGHIYLNKARIQNLVDFAALSASKTMFSTGSKDQAIVDARGTFFLNIDGVAANDELVNIAPTDVLVDFSDTLDPWNSGGEPARFVRVRVDNNPLPSWFMQIVTGVGKNVPAHAVSGAIPVAPCDVFPVTVCAKGGEDVTENVACPNDGETICIMPDGSACADQTDPACCEQDSNNPGSCATVTEKVFDETDQANNYGLHLASETYQTSGAEGTDSSLANRQYCLKYTTKHSSETYCDAAGYKPCPIDGETPCVGDYEAVAKPCPNDGVTTCTSDGQWESYPENPEVPVLVPAQYSEQELADQGLESGNFHILRPPGPGGGNIRDEFAGTSSFCLEVNVGDSDTIEADLNPGNKVGMSVQGSNSRMNCYMGPMNATDAPPDYVSNVGDRNTVDENGNPIVDEGCDIDTVTVGYQTDDAGNYILDEAGNPIPKTQETWGGSYDNDLADEYYQDYGYASAAPDDIAAGAVNLADASCLNSGDCPSFDSDVAGSTWGGKLFHRVFAVPISNCSGIQNGRKDVPVLAFGCFLMTRPMVQQGNEAFLMGQFLGLSSDSNLNPAAAPCQVSEGEINTTSSGGTAGPSKIVLFKAPLIEDA